MNNIVSFIVFFISFVSFSFERLNVINKGRKICFEENADQTTENRGDLIASRFFIPEDDARKTFLSKPNRFIMQIIHNILFYAKNI